MLTGVGLLIARLVLTPYSGPVPPDNVVVDRVIMEGYPQGASVAAATNEVPVGVAVTEHHYVLAFRQRIVALSRVTNGVAFSQSLPEDRYGTVRSVVYDPSFLDASEDSAGASGSLDACPVCSCAAASTITVAIF
jgi:hypothetical protein